MNLQDIYEPDEVDLINQTFSEIDTFLGVDTSLTSKITLEKPEDVNPIFGKSLAGFRMSINENNTGVIEFNPVMFALISDPEFQRKKKREALIEERVHALHVLGNSTVCDIFSQFALDARRFNQNYPGFNVSRAATARLIDIDNSLITRIREFAKKFGIDLDKDIDKEYLEYNSYFTVITSSELGVPALRKLAGLFCQKFGIDIKQIPKDETNGIDPERATAIALTSFLRSIITDGKSFPNKGDLVNFAKEVGIRPLISNGYRLLVIERLGQVDKQIFLKTLEEFIIKCNDIQVLRQLYFHVPMSKEKIRVMEALNIADRDNNIIKLRSSLVELFGLIEIEDTNPFAFERLIASAISQIMKGTSEATYNEGFAEAVSILEYSDLPSDIEERRIFLSNSDYIREMLALMREFPEGMGENGYSPLNNNATRLPNSISSHAQLGSKLGDSAVNSLMEQSWGSVYDSIIAQNISIILQADKSPEEIMTASIKLVKRKQYLDFLVEPIAKVIAMWISNGDIQVGRIISQLSSYVNVDIISEDLLQKMVEILSSWVRNNNLSKIKIFMSQSTVEGQLKILGIES